MSLIRALFIVIASGATLLGVELTEHVHSQRWNVKTLGDGFTVLEAPVPTTIADQQALPTPEVGESVPRLESERTLYTLQANLIEAKREFDGDYHLVLEDPLTGNRMVAEIPEPNDRTPATIRSKFLAARTAVDGLIGKPGMFHAARPSHSMRVEIIGLGFFDEPHMMTPEGMSPNCREIHPVLSVRAL